MNSDDRIPSVLWSLPARDHGYHPGATAGGGDVNFAYLREVALAADRLGYFGVMLPTDRDCEDSWVIASAIAPWTKRLRYLVNVRPGLQSPAAAARMTMALERVSNGRLLVNVVAGDDAAANKGNSSSRDHDERDAATREFLHVYSDLLAGKPCPPVYFDGSSDAEIGVTAGAVDKYLMSGEAPDQVAQKIARVKAHAGRRGRRLSFGIRLHVIVRETNDAAWKAAGDLIQHVADDTTASAQQNPERTDMIARQRMARLHGGRRDSPEFSPNLRAGIGRLRDGGTALIGDPAGIAARIRDYQSVGIDTFIMSGSPQLEEVHRFAELVFPLLSVRRHARAAPLHVNKGRFDETIAENFLSRRTG